MAMAAGGTSPGSSPLPARPNSASAAFSRALQDEGGGNASAIAAREAAVALLATMVGSDSARLTEHAQRLRQEAEVEAQGANAVLEEQMRLAADARERKRLAEQEMARISAERAALEARLPLLTPCPTPCVPCALCALCRILHM